MRIIALLVCVLAAGLFAVPVTALAKASDLDPIPALPADMLEHINVYQAKVLSVYDGDTLTALVDLGFNISFKARVRLYGIDTFEVRGSQRPQGLLARDRMRELVLGKTILFRSVQDGKRITGKFGRYLAVIYVQDPDEPGFINVNRLLVEEGHGTYATY